MQLIPVQLERVLKYKSRAARDHVAIGPTANTDWYIIGVDGAEVGCCAILYTRQAARIKGVWVEPGERGKGHGTAVTLALVAIAKGRDGVTAVEALAYNPAHYEAHGFARVKEQRPGAS
jgi:N-acetylglutamate synthase-like GNAT family acetyltransferase